MHSTMICPDCSALLVKRDPRGDAARYQCPKHGVFRVTHNSEKLGFWRAPIAEQLQALNYGRANVAKGGEPIVVF